MCEREVLVWLRSVWLPNNMQNGALDLDTHLHILAHSLQVASKQVTNNM